jgi:hypothetical protein
LIIGFPDTIIEPEAMMIKIMAASIAPEAVFGLILYPHLTDGTLVLELGQVLGKAGILREKTLLVNQGVCWIRQGRQDSYR